MILNIYTYIACDEWFWFVTVDNMAALIVVVKLKRQGGWVLKQLVYGRSFSHTDRERERERESKKFEQKFINFGDPWLSFLLLPFLDYPICQFFHLVVFRRENIVT